MGTVGEGGLHRPWLGATCTDQLCVVARHDLHVMVTSFSPHISQDVSLVLGNT